jgi:hypothetical protein
MRALSSPLRKQLESAVLAARRAAESASRATLDGLGVFADRRPEHLDKERAALRNGLRAKWRQLGGDRELLVAECAYEQWHRLLFARFLAENHLLLHPEFRVPVTLADCDDLAAELGEPDGWSVAARFAAEILPGIFRLDDPCVRLRFAPEGRDALEHILASLPVEVFLADDALGWVYQFWQKDKKDEINASERKIGGADLGPVTQLFTENYMVRFLLENSLGAWWASRHPDSPLVKGFEYLRFDDHGQPAAGSFDGWPEGVGEVTVMDPCCGSGHFLVEAFSMLWRMRSEEEGLSPVEAQDAVLRDNLFGLEFDPRCTQIAAFSLAFAAWQVGGYRQLDAINVACSGIPIAGQLSDWHTLANGDKGLEYALEQLYMLFKSAPEFGSLVNPDKLGSVEELDLIDYAKVAPLLERALARERIEDPATAVFGEAAVGVAQALSLLVRRYTLVVTNPPFLSRGRQAKSLRDYCRRRHANANSDLAVAFIDRCRQLTTPGGTDALVSPDGWRVLSTYSRFRSAFLGEERWNVLARLGGGAFRAISGQVVSVILSITTHGAPEVDASFVAVDVSDGRTPYEKSAGLRLGPLVSLVQRDILDNPDSRILLEKIPLGPILERVAQAYQGLATGEQIRFTRCFWELPRIENGWEFFQGTVEETKDYAGREVIILWEKGQGQLNVFHEQNRQRLGGAPRRGAEAWGKLGIAVSQMSNLPCTLYSGNLFDNSTAVLIPLSASDLPAVWAFCQSDEFREAVRRIDPTIKVTNSTIAKVPFDSGRWREVAEKQYPYGLPEPWTNDPSQWLFAGRPESSTAELQVAIGRLLGYQWPGHSEADDISGLSDADGIVCLPSVAGEPPAADRLQQLIAAASGETWSSAKINELLEQAESKKKNLADWLRDEFFRQHCALFKNRPFIWHIWDGQRDGFSALVNYHRLDRKTLEKLTYTYLGQDWVERQRAGVRDEVAGAELRLSAALELQHKLEAILEGEKPYDIYVRWKPLHEQPIGWEPDLDDGVRLNIRPFVEAGVLRSPFSIHWRKDRGKNPDGSTRENDIYLSLAEKRQAREEADSA